MAQTDVLSGPARSEVGIESTYGTTPSTTPMFPVTNSFDVSGLARDQVKVEDERVRGFKHITPLHGLKSTNSQVKFDFMFRPDGTQLTQAASPVSHWLGLIMQGLWGNVLNTSYTGTAGSLVAGTGSSPTVVAVTAGQGTRFIVGQWIMVQTSAGYECARIISIATDNLSVYPSLAGTPVATTGIVVNSYTYAPAQSHSASLSLKHSKAFNVSGAETVHQWTMNGCTGDLDFNFDRGQEAKISAALKCASWAGPSAQSYSVAASADTMGVPFVMQGATTLIQLTSTLTRVPYALHSIKAKFNGGMIYLPELGGVEGTTGVMRIPARPFGSATLKFRSDPTQDTTNWTSQNLLSIVCLFPYGSGATTRYMGLDIPSAVIVGKPKETNEGGRMVMTVDVEFLEDTTTSGASTDMAFAPARMFAL